MNRSTLIQLVLLLVLIACLAACSPNRDGDGNEIRSSSENTSYSPKQDPDSEYPGTKDQDTINKDPDNILEAKGNQGHPPPR